MSKPIPLAYTFGNHMHWVDMQWLWGYDVLPGSIDDMLAYCRATGVKGNINFDGIGYEKLASESPEHLTKLRQAIADGTIEVVGGSYGQPYGLFHGGESNVRQRVYGVRTAIRVLGCRPKTFWEEEFDAYPQLPQMLAGCGFTGASLYFQWTWHTPEVPMEEAPVVLWEGIDGTQIPTATRNRMNLHQWPEDFQILLDDLAANPPSSEDGVPPLVLQWLELMPTQDWMCRSELMIPMLQSLKSDPRFEILAVTLGEYLEKWQGKDLPVRRYQMGDFWHGMTLGKNGDNHPKRSAELEHRILEAETASAILGLFGRPYEPWDVYPTWELEECWRNLLAAQHHDNHECEGLCGHVAEAQFSFINTLLMRSNPVKRIAKRLSTKAKNLSMFFNALGWDVKVRGVEVRSMGYCLSQTNEPDSCWETDGNVAKFNSDNMSVILNLTTLIVEEFISKDVALISFPLKFACSAGGKILESSGVAQSNVPASPSIDGNRLSMKLEHLPVHLILTANGELGSLDFDIHTKDFTSSSPIDPGYGGAISMIWDIVPLNAKVTADGPYSVSEISSGSNGKRKYPEGDWMTSTQWFEEVKDGFTSRSFVNIVQPNGKGTLITHSGNQQWFLTESGLENVLHTIDPWDGDIRDHFSRSTVRLQFHNGVTNAECVQQGALLLGHSAQAMVRHNWPLDTKSFTQTTTTDDEPIPNDFSAVTVHSPNVLATAFYREQESFCKRGLTSYGGEGTGHPYILRLVEYDGISGDVEVTLPGPIASAFKTNLMGEIEQQLTPLPDDIALLTTEPEKLHPFGIEAVRIKVPMRAHEIATLYLDIVPGRKQFRDLDAKREIWATVHRVEES